MVIDLDALEALYVSRKFTLGSVPDTVLELIAEVRKARAERDWLATRIALDGVSCPVEPNVCAGTCADHIQCWLEAAREAVAGKE